jgi:hypothetical protein
METENNWDSLIERLVSSLETSRRGQVKSTIEANAEASRELRSRILLSAKRLNKPKKSTKEK